MDLSVSDAHIAMAVGNYVFPFLVSYYKTKEPEYYIRFFYLGDHLKTYSLSALIFNMFIPLSSSTSLLR